MTFIKIGLQDLSLSGTLVPKFPSVWTIDDNSGKFINLTKILYLSGDQSDMSDQSDQSILGL